MSIDIKNVGGIRMAITICDYCKKELSRTESLYSHPAGLKLLVSNKCKECQPGVGGIKVIVDPMMPKGDILAVSGWPEWGSVIRIEDQKKDRQSAMVEAMSRMVDICQIGNE